MANLLLASYGITPPLTVGQNQTINYINQHNTLKTAYFWKYNKQQTKYKDLITIFMWFNRIQAVIAQYNILLEDTFNFNETRYIIGVIATAKVVMGILTYYNIYIQPRNREWITAVKYISAIGWALLFMLIFAGKVYLSTQYTTDLPFRWTIVLSKDRWTNNKLKYYQLIKIFNPYIYSRIVGRYQLLILDSYSSYITPEFDQYCLNHNIIPLCMPPHLSHLLQPLDIGCFATLKQLYGYLIEDYIQLSIYHINKLNFIMVYLTAYTEALMASNIYSRFAATGLVPFDPS